MKGMLLNMDNNSEMHLFILWEKSLYKKDEIISQIKEKFKIIKIYNVKWSDKYFISNLSRFYGTNLLDCKAKAEHCGTGEFLLIIVKDENPIYENRNTSKGIKNLNINMFDSKEKFREITGGGHKVHATNDEIETNHDITLLLGISLNDFKNQNSEEWNGEIENLKKDLFGYNGWDNVQQMFYALNNCTKYAILRNYEGLPEEIYINEHNDIDLICESKENCALILNAEKVFPQDYRIHYRAKVKDKYANFDLRYIGDNYYCEKLETNILNNRVYNDKGFFVLSDEDYFYTLLYHAIIHKRIFKEDYKKRLANMNDTNIIDENSKLEDMIKILKNWLSVNKYLITIPDDKSVDFNIQNAKQFRPLLQLEQTNKKLQQFNDNIIKWYPFKKSKNILLVGENEIIEKYLKTKTENLIVLSRIEKTNKDLTNYEFDYILIYGIENYEDSIFDIRKYLNDGGKLIIIGDNTFGINNWSNYSINLESIKLENNNFDKTTISKVRDRLIENGLNNTNTFYCFPNYKETEVLINENHNIEDSQIDRYNQNIELKQIKVFDEINILKKIIREQPKMLEFFTNSYFIEASKNSIDTDIKYVSYNNCRNEKYKLITLLKENIVEKISANEESKEHLGNMKQIIQDIKNMNTDKIQVLDYEENGKIFSKLIKNYKTLDVILAEYYNNFEEIQKILNDLKNILIQNSVNYEECKNNIDKLGQPEELLNKLHYMPKAFWDMISKNCFYIENKFVFFDQEWVKEYLPVEFIIYRSVINSYDLIKKIDVDKLLEKLEILQYKEYFQKIDESIRKEILNQEVFEEMYKTETKGVDNLINENAMYKNYIDKLENEVIRQVNEDNSKKQEYIIALENRVKQLEEVNSKNEKIIKKILFWKR